MKDGALFGALIVVVCAAGFASQWETVDRFLSTVFAWVLFGGGGLLLAGWLVREAWEAWQDWRVIGPPDLGPLRRKREPAGEQEVPR